MWRWNPTKVKGSNETGLIRYLRVNNLTYPWEGGANKVEFFWFHKKKFTFSEDSLWELYTLVVVLSNEL